MSENPEGEGPVHLGPVSIDHQHERKLMILGVVVSVIALALFLWARRSAGAATIPALDPTGAGGGDASGGSAGLTPDQILAMQLELAGLQIAHSAQYALALDTNTLSHDIGSHDTSGSGSGGISIFGIGIGGSGSSSSHDTWDLTTQSEMNAELAGSNLSAEEFALLIQQGQAIITAEAANQSSVWAAAADKLDRYRLRLTGAPSPPPPGGGQPYGHSPTGPLHV